MSTNRTHPARRAIVGAVAIAAAVACRSHAPALEAPPPRPPPTPDKPLVHVVLIDLDFDESSEDQADALTGALRSRVANMMGWRLDPSRPSTTLLISALQCPRPPDSACLNRFGDQLKTDHYFWGIVTKAGTPGHVVAEVHYWSRGEIEQVLRETYSDNLTDQNDDALRRIASQLLERLATRQRSNAIP